MAGALDSIMRSVAQSLVGTFGTTGVLTTYSGGSYDPTTDTTSAGAATDTTVPCSPPEGYRNSLIDGTRIQAGDMKVLIPALDCATAPTTAQKFTIRGAQYNVISVMPISSGNQEAAWELQLRR